jgi:crotonobetainyl-CoA:carnitine CoA-transferase CaiB-like acyl-CoA transferase
LKNPSLVALSSIAAIEYRDRTGIGQFIELAQVEAQGAIMGPSILDATVNQNEWDALGYGEILGDHYAPYGAYPCKGEDNWVVIAVSEESEWEGLVNALGNPTWINDEKYSSYEKRKENQKDLDAQIGAWSSEYTRYQAMRILQNNGVPAGAVLNGEDLYSNIHLRKRGHIVDIHEPPWGDLSHQGLPAIPGMSEAHADGLPPWIGDHNDYVFGEILGMTDKDINEGINSGAIN